MVCPNCNKISRSDGQLCTDCGYPFAGSDGVKSKFIASQVIKASEIAESRDMLRTARILLFLAGPALITESLWSGANWNDLLLDSMLAVSFIVFAIILKKDPILFTSGPLLLFFIRFTVQIITNMEAFHKGGIFMSEIFSHLLKVKLAVAIGLILALRGAILAERYRKESAYLRKQ